MDGLVGVTDTVGLVAAVFSDALPAVIALSFGGYVVVLIVRWFGGIGR